MFLDHAYASITSTGSDHQVKITFTLKEPSMAVNIRIDYRDRVEKRDSR